MLYADIGRPAATLWEHPEAVKRMHEQGQRSVDEHAIAAIDEQRRGIEEAYGQSKAARRAVVRGTLAATGADGGGAKPDTGSSASDDDSHAKVPMPGDRATSGVEFW